MNPTFQTFVSRPWPQNAYVKYPGFDSLYVRKGDIGVNIGDGKVYRCTKVIQIGSITATKPGNGAWTRFVDYLVDGGWAIFVENAGPRYGEKLLRMGFVRVNEGTGNHFLFNHEGHLTEWV